MLLQEDWDVLNSSALVFPVHCYQFLAQKKNDCDFLTLILDDTGAKKTVYSLLGSDIKSSS